MEIHRRSILKAAGAVSVTSLAPQALSEPPSKTVAWKQRILDFLSTHARPDGGYAWQNQLDSHLTPTFAAVGCYRILGCDLPNPATTADFVRTHHPRELKKLEQEHHHFEYQQIQSLLWLGADVSAFRPTVQSWSKPYVYLKQYEKNSYPIMRSELAVFTCRDMLGLPIGDLNSAFIEYLDSRRRTNGSFNNTPAADESDGHLLNTLWGLQSLEILGRLEENKGATIEWLRQCQLENGGFTWSPTAEIAKVDDVAYTWAATWALKMLGASVRDQPKCIAYLQSLLQSDGGFSDRPDWQSNPLATYYALDALRNLDALDSLEHIPETPLVALRSINPEMKVFSILIEAHGQGSPADAVELARALKIHWWGCKNAKPEWMARAREIADADHVDVQFFVANEEYGTWVDMPGMGTYSHTSDVIGPSQSDIGDSLADKGVVSWNDFHRLRLPPLQRAGGQLVWQFGENEELVRLLLDDSLARGGYAAISTFHFGNPDFTNSEPFLHRWHGKLPWVALHDAHGPEPWWFSDQIAGFRTLFLAKEPTWNAWLEALQSNLVVAVRHDAVSGLQTWMHGQTHVLKYVGENELDWRWWDNPTINRPMVSMVVVDPNAPFENANEFEDTTLRVRCAWENTTQGEPKAPIVDFESLTVDGELVNASLVTKLSKRGNGLSDCYYFYTLKSLAPGEHHATAVVRSIKSSERIEKTIRFVLR